MFTVIFKTKNLNRDFYLNAIDEIFEHWKISDRDESEWIVNIYPIDHEKNNSEFYKGLTDSKTSDKMAWRFTGQKEITCFLIDSNNHMNTLSNFAVISHEIGHAVGMIIFLRRNDIFVKEIHQIYYDHPQYQTLTILDKKIRILDLSDMMTKERLCNIDFGGISSYQYSLNAYSIYYYRTKYQVEITLLE